jgi:acyl-CoA reductase-like NAD-dependent aldehyde dehydrogenase
MTRPRNNKNNKGNAAMDAVSPAISKQRSQSNSARLPVRKTYKLYIGGAFPRSESGRTYPVSNPQGAFVANVARASRKDVRDAVGAAAKAFSGWSARTPYNRGQILYRVAEILEGRRAQFVDELVTTEGIGRARAEQAVDAAVDRWVWYAGWADKYAQVVGATNPVAGPYLNLSSPEPSGIVGVLAPPAAPLLGLVSVVAPVIATGNTCVVLASESHPLAAVTLAEVLATSDLPGGVVNLLTGPTTELAPWLAGHEEVRGLDLTGADAADAVDWERLAAANLKRVRRPDRLEDWAADPALSRMTTFVETKTIWHPIGV